MGESLVEAPNLENKISEPVTSRTALEVSISFGRYDNDSLSWEKWSSFSPNKYLEEVEKCSTPGSVAQKKAYFEAHYKKIAARKAELLEPENPMGTEPSTSGETDSIDHITSTSGSNDECGNLEGQSFTEEVEPDTNSLGAISSSHADEPTEYDADAVGYQNLLLENSKEEINGDSQESRKLVYPEGAALVTEESFDRSQDAEEQTLKVDNDINSSESKEDKSKLDAQNISQKVTETKKEHNLIGVKKKRPVPPTTKSLGMSTPRLTKHTSSSTMPSPSKQKATSSPRLSKSTSTSAPRSSKPISTYTPRLSKPISTTTAMSVSLSSTKKANISSLRRSKNSSSAEIKRAAPTSLHLSLSLDTANVDSASLTTTRKSLFMEQMGDKDIVKRAFKTFQNNLNQLKPLSDKNSRGTKQILARGAEHKVSSSITTQKDYERTRKATEKMNAQRNHLGTRGSSISSRSLEQIRVEKTMKVTSSSTGFRSAERSEKQKEIFKKLEEKSCSKEEEKTRPTSKKEKDAEVKRLRQSLNFRAKPIPGVYQGHRMSKTPDKEGGKNEILRQQPSNRGGNN